MTNYLIKHFFHGVVFPQQVEDLILTVHRRLTLTGAAEILGHLTRIVLILFELPPLGQLCGGECDSLERNTEREKRTIWNIDQVCLHHCSLFSYFLPFHGRCIPLM